MGLEDKPFLLRWSSEDMSWGVLSPSSISTRLFSWKKTVGAEGDLYEVHPSGTDHAQQFAHTGWRNRGTLG